MRAAARFSMVSLFSLWSVAPASAQERLPETLLQPLYPPGEENAAEIEPPPPPPRYTEGNIDYDVTYDDSVAQTYDDGYDPQAAAQFDETLSPYGTWVDDDVYGRVWQPSAEVGRRRFLALRHRGALAVDRVRLDLDLRLGLGLGAVSLRPLARRRRARLVLDAGHAVGAGLGQLARRRRLRRAGRRSRRDE